MTSNTWPPFVCAGDITHHTSVGELPMEIGPSPTQFQRDFVAINDGEKGLVVFNKGLPEYEAKTKLGREKMKGDIKRLNYYLGADDWFE